MTTPNFFIITALVGVPRGGVLLANGGGSATPFPPPPSPPPPPPPPLGGLDFSTPDDSQYIQVDQGV